MRNEISVLIVEDEDIWIKALKLIIQDLGMTVVKAVKTVEEALVAFAELEYDIILIDIQIGKTSTGIELGNVVHREYNKPYIYITAGHGYDIEKISASHPAAYLQKPISANSLSVAINQALELHNQLQSGKPANSDASVFFVKEGTTYKKLNWKDIAYISAGKNYVSIHNVTDNAEYYIRNSLQKTLSQLIPKQLQENFVQVNRSQIVQFSHITEITSDEVVIDSKKLTLSDIFIKDLKRRMNIV